MELVGLRLLGRWAELAEFAEVFGVADVAAEDVMVVVVVVMLVADVRGTAEEELTAAAVVAGANST